MKTLRSFVSNGAPQGVAGRSRAGKLQVRRVHARKLRDLFNTDAEGCQSICELATQQELDSLQLAS